MLEIYFHRRLDQVLKQIDDEIYLLRIFHSEDAKAIVKEKPETLTSDNAKDWKLKEHLYSELDVIDRRLTQFLPLLAGLFTANGVMLGWDLTQLTDPTKHVPSNLVETVIVTTGISFFTSIFGAIISVLSPTSWVSRWKQGITNCYMEKRYGEYCCTEKPLIRLQMLVFLITTRIGRDKRLVLTKKFASAACILFILSTLLTLFTFIEILR